MISTTILFQGNNKPDGRCLAFAFKEAFAVRLNASCEIEYVDTPRMGSNFAKNIERSIERARKIAANNFGNRTCVYIIPGWVPVTRGDLTILLGFAYVLAFYRGRLAWIEMDSEQLSDEHKRFEQGAALAQAGMSRLRPIVEVPEEEQDQGKRLVLTTLEGLRIAMTLIGGDYPHLKRSLH